MRNRKPTWILIAGLLVSAGPVSAVEFRLVAQQPGTTSPSAEPLLYDVYLDTQGDSRITSFSVSLRYDATMVTYRPDLSDADDYYPLYAPAGFPGAKATLGHPATWLVPESDPPRFSSSAVDADLSGQINIEFGSNAFPNTSTWGTSTNLYLATIAFDAPTEIDAFTRLVWGMEGEGNHFYRSESVAPVIPTFFILGDDFIHAVPEPGTALLVSVGLVALGLTRPRRD